MPGIGDSLRHWTPMKDGRSLWWKVIARNKRLITLTLSKSRAQELFRELVRTADIVIENYHRAYSSVGVSVTRISRRSIPVL